MGLSDDAALARLYEGQEAGDDIRPRKLGSNFFAGLFHIEIRAVEQAVGFAECAGVLGDKSTALEADLIDATDLGGVAISNHVGRDVLNDFCAASDDRMLSQAAELMNSGEPTDDDMVLYCDMPGDSAVIRKNDMVADGTIVRDVGVGEKVSVMTDDGLGSWKGAAVDRAKFAERVVVSDFQIGRLGGVFQILRALTDRAVGIKNVPLPDACGTGYGDMANEARSTSNLDLRANVAEWPDLNIGV